MPRRPRPWRITLRAASVLTILLTLAASASICFNYGIVAPTGHFLCWFHGSICIGANASFDSFEFFANARPLTTHNLPSLVSLIVLADHRIDIPAWLAPLPTLGICVLAFVMTRTPPHHCRKCRYDLRGLSHAPSGKTICPECGAESPQ